MISVRLARRADLIPARNVSEAAFATLRQTYRPTRKALARKRKSRGDGLRLVAEFEGRIVGTVEYEVLADQLCLMGLGVHPESTRRGVATALLKKLQQIAEDSGIRRITLWTVVQTGNVEIFQRLGFRVVSIHPADLFESTRHAKLTEAFMERLNSASSSTR